MGQLYGDFDDATHEWTDGVLACYMRDLSEEQNLDKKWMMFDGAYFPPNTFRLCDCPNTRLTLSFLSGQVKHSRGGSKKSGKKITGLSFMPGDDRKLLVTRNDSRNRVYDGYSLA